MTASQQSQNEPVGRPGACAACPQSASLYVGAICLAALVAATAALAYDGADGHDWTAFLLLLPLAAVAPFFRVAVGRNYSLHTGPAFIVAGALVLDPRCCSASSPPCTFRSSCAAATPGTSTSSTSPITR